MRFSKTVSSDSGRSQKAPRLCQRHGDAEDAVDAQHLLRRGGWYPLLPRTPRGRWPAPLPGLGHGTGTGRPGWPGCQLRLPRLSTQTLCSRAERLLVSLVVIISPDEHSHRICHRVVHAPIATTSPWSDFTAPSNEKSMNTQAPLQWFCFTESHIPLILINMINN